MPCPSTLVTMSPDAPGPEPSTPHRAGTKTVGWLQGVWAELLDLDAYPVPEANFFSLGGTSLLTLSLLARIEAERGVSIPAIEVMALPTLRELADLIDAGGSGAPRLLRSFGTIEPGLPPLVLVPGRRGMGLAFEETAKLLDTEFNVYVFDYPGIQEGTVALETIEAIADELVRAVRAEGVPEALAVYGYSLGAWIALEAARRLRGEVEIVGVGVGDIPTAELRPRIKESVVGLSVRTSDSPYWRWRRLRRRIGNVVLRRADVAAVDALHPQVQAASDRALVAYRGEAVTDDLLVITTPARRGEVGDDLGWSGATSGSVVTVAVGGEHVSMHETELDAIVAALQTYFLPRLRS